MDGIIFVAKTDYCGPLKRMTNIIKGSSSATLWQCNGLPWLEVFGFLSFGAILLDIWIEKIIHILVFMAEIKYENLSESIFLVYAQDSQERH